MENKVKKRGTIKSKLTIFAGFVNELNLKEIKTKADITQLQHRVNKIQPIIDEFDAIQGEIEISTDTIDEEFTERETFETKYFNLIALANTIIESNQFDTEGDTGTRDLNNDANSIVSNNLNQHIKLPKIELPKFDGDYSKWLEFRDTYESLIHSNDSISGIQKFHYLRASLGGTASQVIQSLEFTSVNYTIAWDALLDRYDNNKILIHHHIKSIFLLDSLFKESSVELRKILDVVAKNLRALEQLGQPTNNWDALINYIIATKLDTSTLKEWENYAKDIEMPKWSDMKTFLGARASLLETIQTNQSEREGKSKKVHEKSIKNTRGLLTTDKPSEIKCVCCNNNHYIHNCAEFLKLNTNERVEKARNLKLCLNCLRIGHNSISCRRGSCKNVN